MENKPKPIFAEGIRFYHPRDGAPEFVKGQIVIDFDELREFAEKNGITNVMRLDMLKSKEKGTIYMTLNTWKPTKPPEIGTVEAF